MRTVEKADGRILGAFSSLDELEAALRTAEPDLVTPLSFFAHHASLLGEKGPFDPPLYLAYRLARPGPWGSPLSLDEAAERAALAIWALAGTLGGGFAEEWTRVYFPGIGLLESPGPVRPLSGVPARRVVLDRKAWPILRKRVWEMLREESPWGFPQPDDHPRVYAYTNLFGWYWRGEGHLVEARAEVEVWAQTSSKAFVRAFLEGEGGRVYLLPERRRVGTLSRHLAELLEEAEERLEAAARGLRSARKELGVRG